MYCSKKCADKAYRERKKLKESGGLVEVKAPKATKEPKKEKPSKAVISYNHEDNYSKKYEGIEIPPETGPKLKWCNFCGASIENSKKKGFCDSDHEKMYWYAVKKNSPLKIRIDAKTLIETRKYERVQELIDAMLSRNTLMVKFS